MTKNNQEQKRLSLQDSINLSKDLEDECSYLALANNYLRICLLKNKSLIQNFLINKFSEKTKKRFNNENTELFLWKNRR